MVTSSQGTRPTQGSQREGHLDSQVGFRFFFLSAAAEPFTLVESGGIPRGAESGRFMQIRLVPCGQKGEGWLSLLVPCNP